MTTLAIELNDAAIAVARSGRLVATETGYAIAAGAELAFGDAALQSSRLRPRDANDRYWAELATRPLARPLAHATSHADLAHAQLLQLWKQYAAAGDDVVLAVPGSFDREQLGLLLGIADACGMPVSGLVDAAVAACPCPYPGWDSIHVEAQLHGIGLTRIGETPNGDAAIAETFETASPIGVARLRERWARRIAATFVAQTRFDPLSDGKTEQRLFDALGGWIAAFGDLPSANVEFEVGQATKRIQLARTELVAEAADVYDRLAECVASARRPGRGLAVRVGSILAGLPGATERLAQVPGVRVVALPAGAGALGALACAKQVLTEPGGIALVKSLAWRSTADPLPPLGPEELTDPAAATHLLIGNVAHPIGDGAIKLQSADARGLEIVGTGADDRVEFALRRFQDGLQLECVGSRGVLVNGRIAESGTRLRAGDRIALAGSGEEARLIAVRGDGT